MAYRDWGATGGCPSQWRVHPVTLRATGERAGRRLRRNPTDQDAIRKYLDRVGLPARARPIAAARQLPLEEAA